MRYNLKSGLYDILLSASLMNRFPSEEKEEEKEGEKKEEGYTLGLVLGCLY